LVLRPGYRRGRGCYFKIPFSGRHGTMTADRGARQTARGPPPARLVAPPTPPTPEMGRVPFFCLVMSRLEIQTRAQPGHAGPGFRISEAGLSGNHPNGAPPAGVLRAAAAAPLGCAELYTVISTCRFRAAAARERGRDGRKLVCAQIGTARQGLTRLIY